MIHLLGTDQSVMRHVGYQLGELLQTLRQLLFILVSFTDNLGNQSMLWASEYCRISFILRFLLSDLKLQARHTATNAL